MQTPFYKMHGAGNDFVVFDGRGAMPALPPARIAALCDRHRGIGCDQLVLLEPGHDGADAGVRFFNNDGSESGTCGNASRCVADLLAAETGRPTLRLATGGGVLEAEALAPGWVSVNMGAARFGWQDVPLARAMDTLHLDLPGDPAGCSMGNPHATFFVPDLDAVDIAGRGAALEHDALFPERANIGFAQMIDAGRMRLRVWERGTGLTLACGSGACAAAVNAARRGVAGRHCVVVMDGGAVEIAWREDGAVSMTGPSVTAYRGSIDLDAYPS